MSTVPKDIEHFAETSDFDYHKLPKCPSATRAKRCSVSRGSALTNSASPSITRAPSLFAWALAWKQELRMYWKVLFCITVWWMSAVVSILNIKSTVSAGGIYPYPFAFTSFSQVAVGCLAAMILMISNQSRVPFSQLSWMHFAQLFAIGVMQGFEIGLTNKSLEYLSVAVRTFVASAGVLTMMATAWCWRLEHMCALRCLSALFVIIGGSFQAANETQAGHHTHTIGVLLQIVSMIIGSQRQALTQWILQKNCNDSVLANMSKLQILAFVMPITGLVCVPLGFLFEDQPYALANFTVELSVSVFLVALGLIFMVNAELQLIQLLSAVALAILAAVHQVPIVLAGTLVSGTSLRWNQIVGFICCLAATLLYGMARRREKVEASRAPPTVPEDVEEAKK